MLHEPAVQEDQEDHAAGYKSKIGIRLFIVYAIVFAIFILANTLAPGLMGIILKEPLGLNVAILFGFFLIILAIILGIIYNILCTAKEKELNS